MPSFTGRYRYKTGSDAAEQSGLCRVVVDEQNLQIIPEKGLPIAMDLGDIDEYAPEDYELNLTIYDGSLLVLSHFGKTFQNLAHDLLAAFRDRTIQCLLLEDLEEVLRVDGAAQLDSAERKFSSRSEIRLYRSNVAILPERAAGMQWRLADIDAMEFDEANHALNLLSLSDRLILGRLAKRTGEFEQYLKSSMSDVSEKAAKVRQRLFPFLSPDQFQKLSAVFKEGRAARISDMELIHSKIGHGLLQQTVSAALRPYFDELQKLSVEKEMFAGFKLIRKEAEDDETAGPDESGEEPGYEPPEASGEEQPVLHWYFLPLCSTDGKLRNVVAWEVVSRGRRATYFFRLVPAGQEGVLQDAARVRGILDDSIRRLNQALVLLNFRREPIYLKDESLKMQPRYRRYAIACRKMPVLRQLRSAFLGRALHTSMQDWEEQVKSILAGTPK